MSLKHLTRKMQTVQVSGGEVTVRAFGLHGLVFLLTRHGGVLRQLYDLVSAKLPKDGAGNTTIDVGQLVAMAPGLAELAGQFPDLAADAVALACNDFRVGANQELDPSARAEFLEESAAAAALDLGSQVKILWVAWSMIQSEISDVATIMGKAQAPARKVSK